MTNSTLDYWSIIDRDGNEVSLETQAWGIDNCGGTLEAPPKRRGSNLTVPHRPGQIWRPQIADSRTLTFNMWVLSCDEDGVTPSGAAAQEAQLLENWQMLRTLFWGAGGSQLSLTKRWSDGYGEASGDAVFVSGLEPMNLGLEALRFSVDLHMADPYFYGGLVTAEVTTAGLTVDNIGDDAVTDLQLDFAGSGSGSYILSNATTGETLTVANFGTLQVLTKDFEATKSAASIIGDVSSTADSFWMTLASGDNALDINQGACDVTWRPVYW